VALITGPSREWAEECSRGLVEGGLAACVNRIGPVLSCFRWQGEIQQEEEWLLVVKTTGDRISQLETWLREHHPYQVFELVALPVSAGSGTYLDWVRSEVGT